MPIDWGNSELGECWSVVGSPSVVAVSARKLKATQDILDALDRAIVDEKRLHPSQVQQPEIGTA